MNIQVSPTHLTILWPQRIHKMSEQYSDKSSVGTDLESNDEIDEVEVVGAGRVEVVGAGKVES